MTLPQTLEDRLNSNDTFRGGAVEDVLFDGFAVYAALDDRAKKRTSAENVADVLDAVVRILRRRAAVGAATTPPEKDQL